MSARSMACMITLFLLFAAAANAAPTPGNSAELTTKESQPTGKPTYEGRVKGDTIETPFVIDWLPFVDSMDTCPFIHDYDEACPYTSSASPDVVYSYYCQYPCVVDIDLCASSYDTKVFVYENEHTPGDPLGCNDDYSGCGPDGYRSWLRVNFEQGNTYYIVIDGYGSDCGVYELYIEAHVPCVACPSGAVMETEPECIDPENDVDNGGCNSVPPVFQVIHPSENTIDLCGTSGTYYQSGVNWRDTDWYQMDLTQTSEVTVRCLPNFEATIGFVDGREGCDGVSTFYSYTSAPTCFIAELTETLAPGTWWLWVGPTNFTDVPCGRLYHCEISGYTLTTPAEHVSWSTLKALHRAGTR